MKLVKYNKYPVSTVSTDGLVCWHQGISSYNMYAQMCFQLLMD